MIIGANKPKKIRKRPFWSLSLRLLPRKRYFFIASMSALISGISLIGIIVYKQTIGAPENKITKVVFAPESVKALSDITIYKSITDYLVNKNTMMLKRFGKTAFNHFLENTSPLIETATFEQSAPNTLFVTVTFKKPRLVRQTPTTQFISYEQKIYPVTSGSILLDEIFAIQLPKFSSGRTDINGIYQHISEDSLVTTKNALFTTLATGSISEIIYQPGGKRLFITYKGKRVYFNLAKDFPTQLKTLIDLEANRRGFPNVRTIDIGSREEVIVR